VNENNGISLLLITGTMGAGKSTVMAEASDVLTIQHVEHAAVDGDALGAAYLESMARNDEVIYANLECVCKNYAQLGVRRFLLAFALENRAALESCVRAVSAHNVVVCRLDASLPTMQDRIKLREPGLLQAEFVARVETLNAILDRASLEAFTVTNEGRSVTEVAREMLIRAGWLPDTS
jgi:deoxyadenosine/deoxycytidine kinase